MRQLALAPLRRSVLVLGLAITLVAVPTLAMADSANSRDGSSGTKPTIVLVHGAWADGSSWSHVAQSGKIALPETDEGVDRGARWANG